MMNQGTFINWTFSHMQSPREFDAAKLQAQVWLEVMPHRILVWLHETAAVGMIVVLLLSVALKGNMMVVFSMIMGASMKLCESEILAMR